MRAGELPQPLALVGRWVDTPGEVFRVGGNVKYRGKVVGVETKRANSVLVRFQDEPQKLYHFPVPTVLR
jgi:hypothetical protein